jgi:hypothetical protein
MREDWLTRDFWFLGIHMQIGCRLLRTQYGKSVAEATTKRPLLPLPQFKPTHYPFEAT